MKKEKIPKSQNQKKDDEMLPEYDFRGGVRGKHHEAYRRGHSVTIHQTDGTTDVRHFKLEDGAVMLEPDVREIFPGFRNRQQSFARFDYFVAEKNQNTSANLIFAELFIKL